MWNGSKADAWLSPKTVIGTVGEAEVADDCVQDFELQDSVDGAVVVEQVRAASRSSRGTTEAQQTAASRYHRCQVYFSYHGTGLAVNSPYTVCSRNNESDTCTAIDP